MRLLNVVFFYLVKMYEFTKPIKNIGSRFQRDSHYNLNGYVQRLQRRRTITKTRNSRSLLIRNCNRKIEYWLFPNWAVVRIPEGTNSRRKKNFAWVVK